MPQYNRNDLEIAARNQHFTRDTFEKVLRLKTILDWIRKLSPQMIYWRKSIIRSGKLQG